MTASATTKLQVNFKLNDGTLINLYADSAPELQALLASLEQSAATIGNTATALTGGRVSAAIKTELGGTVVAQSSNLPEGHCKHGALQYRESKPGAPKTWKGWFCPSPKGTPDQCAPKFIR